MTELCTIMSTTPNKDVARTIASALVEKRLAACINIVDNVESVYHWQGEVHNDHECLMIIKTQQGLVEQAYETLVDLHPYDEPEWVVQHIDAGSETYLDWIRRSTG